MRCKDWSHADHVVCKHAVESAEMLGWDGGIRGGGGDRSIEVGTGMLGGAVGGAAGRPIAQAKWKLAIGLMCF